MVLLYLIYSARTGFDARRRYSEQGCCRLLRDGAIGFDISRQQLREVMAFRRFEHGDLLSSSYALRVSGGAQCYSLAFCLALPELKFIQDSIEYCSFWKY